MRIEFSPTTTSAGSSRTQTLKRKAKHRTNGVRCSLVATRVRPTNDLLPADVSLKGVVRGGSYFDAQASWRDYMTLPPTADTRFAVMLFSKRSVVGRLQKT